MAEFGYIPWGSDTSFQMRTALGSSGAFYHLHAAYNIRGGHWSMSIISEDDDVVIQNRKLQLGVNLLENCHSKNNPNCILIPWSEDETVLDITDDNMINGNVKLLHILKNELG